MHGGVAPPTSELHALYIVSDTFWEQRVVPEEFKLGPWAGFLAPGGRNANSNDDPKALGNYKQQYLFQLPLKMGSCG